MPASRDQSQKITFLFPNRDKTSQSTKVNQTENALAINHAVEGTRVIKAKTNTAVDFEHDIQTYQAQAFVENHFPADSSPVESLKNNLDKLNDLHERLKFLLGELEDLSEDD